MSEVKPMAADAANEATVLLVDDDPMILKSLRRALHRTPWTLLAAGSGAEALALMEREPVWVVVADYRMPEMDGLDLLNRIKQRWPLVQRVMLTGAANLEVIERAVNESEVYRFLNKPWSDSQLRATVGDCIDRVALERSNERYRQELAERNRQLEEINRELERQVEQRTAALLHAEKMAALGRMAGGVAHEINNPLGGILAFAQVLARDLGGEGEHVEALDTIQTCATRCKTIVDNLLSFSRKPAGEAGGRLSINEVVEVAMGVARLHPRAKDAQVELELSPGLPPVFGRASMLQQVLVNLLQNAFQAAEDEPEVRVRTSCEAGEVVVAVGDRGSGIADDVLPHIFEPFYTTKETGQGTGLGLSICYGIVQEHGGRLEVDSRAGTGTTFFLRLPIAASGEEDPS
jgi:signal transduction histidine kinase